MSSRHCIEKILEKQHSPTLSRKPTSNERIEITRASKSKFPGSFLMHLPQDTPRPFTGEPYCSISPVYYSRMKRCCCPDCSHPPEPTPPWLQRSSSPMFLEADKQSRSPCFSNHPYGFGYDRDYRAPGNSSLAARPKHQSSGISMGVSKRKKRHRTAFTPTQLLGLENSFEQNQYSVGEERKQLAEFLGLSETQIKVWFQNRRTKWKRIRKEAEEDDEEAKGEADRNHDNYRNYESCYPHCTTDRDEQPARVYPYERLWSFHQPPLGRETRGQY